MTASAIPSAKKYGRTLLSKIPNRILKEEHLKEAPDSIRRNGGKAVFVGRFTAALRVLIPGLSGISHVPYRSFAAWNIAGGTMWASGFVLLGYAAGSRYQRVAHNVTLFGLGLLLAVVLLIAVKKVRARRATNQPKRESADT